MSLKVKLRTSASTKFYFRKVVLTPLQKALERRGEEKKLVGISISLIPSTSNLQLHQPQKMPTNIPCKI